MKIGILLINLGTPTAPTESAVGNYLSEFLTDPYVITLPKWIRHFLVKKIIVPKRSKTSAHAYQQIWTNAGSPLLVNSLALQAALQKKLGDAYCVSLGMRYSKPSIADGFDFLLQHHCEKLIVLPLYPQFAHATTQSSLDIVNKTIARKKIACTIIRDFYNHNFYIDSYADIISRALEKNNSEFILFSYHGLPVRQDKNGQYRADCFETTRLMAAKLNLSPEKYATTFQSRLGFTKWIEPYTDQTLSSLRKKNITRLSVVCPSFVADCIETLEEINIRLRAGWMRLGGESFDCVPCLNAQDQWIIALKNTFCAMRTDNVFDDVNHDG